MVTVCKYCLERKILFHPCKCSDGVCVECIHRWTKTRTGSMKRCEICHADYSFAEIITTLRSLNRAGIHEICVAFGMLMLSFAIAIGIPMPSESIRLAADIMTANQCYIIATIIMITMSVGNGFVTIYNVYKNNNIIQSSIIRTIIFLFCQVVGSIIIAIYSYRYNTTIIEISLITFAVGVGGISSLAIIVGIVFVISVMIQIIVSSCRDYLCVQRYDVINANM